MKHVIPLALLLVAVISWIFWEPLPANGVIQGPKPSSYDTGLTLEDVTKKDPNKSILLEVYVDWCKYCQKATPILNSAAKTYAKKISFVMVDADNPINAKVVETFEVTGYPSVYFLDIKKKLIYKIPNHTVYDAALLDAELKRLTN